jgi:hypothetical protein
MSMTALMSAALVLLHPTRLFAAGACALNAVASVYGWWDMLM